jgi:hypothetical protein
MNNFGIFFIFQLCLAFGMAGLLWPEKFMPVFDVLMFPWAASYRAIRIHSITALGFSLLLLLTLVLKTTA